jgi:hypothetical protein
MSCEGRERRDDAGGAAWDPAQPLLDGRFCD